DGLPGVERRLFPAKDGVMREVVEHVGHHVAKIGQVGIAGVKAVGGAAIKPLGNLAECPCAAVLEHPYDFAVLLAHASHNLPGGVELAELPPQVALESVEFV